MNLQYKIFTEKGYEDFCKKAGLHPDFCESFAHDGQYTFERVYFRTGSGYHPYIVGTCPTQKETEFFTHNDIVHYLHEQNRAGKLNLPV